MFGEVLITPPAQKIFIKCTGNTCSGIILFQALVLRYYKNLSLELKWSYNRHSYDVWDIVMNVKCTYEVT